MYSRRAATRRTLERYMYILVELEPGTTLLHHGYSAKSIDQHVCCAVKDVFKLIWIVQ